MINMSHRTRLVLFGITLFLVVVGYSMVSGDVKQSATPEGEASPSESRETSDNSAHSKKKGKPVDIYAVKKLMLSDSVEVLGTARANESVDLSAPITENIKQLYFADGEYVLKGSLIALLEQREEQAQLKAATAQLEEHERELTRLKRLQRSKATSVRTVEERQTLVEISRQLVEEINARIADRTIRAPFDGVLGIRQVSVGTLVSSGDILTTIDDIYRIKLDFYVPSVFLAELRAGNAIEARAEALNNRIFEGKIDTINTRVDPATRSVLVRAVLPNPDLTLKPGLLMKIDLIRNEREALVVPEESVIQRKDKFFVLVVGDDMIVNEREIQVGTHYPAKMEVVSGLEEGEKIVVRGVHTARNGQPVTINETWEEIRKPKTQGL